MVKEENAIYVLVGQDPYLENEAIKEISAYFFRDPSSIELNFRLFLSGESDTDEILSYLSTAPFSADKRLAVIKDFDRFQNDDRARISEFAKKMPPSAVLVIQTADISAAQEFGLTAGAKIRYFDRMSEEKAVSWIVRRASIGKKEIAPEAAMTLVELHGRNFSMLENELEKLIAYTGSRSRIDDSDIHDISGRTLFTSAFDLARAIEANRVDDAMKIANELLVSGKKHYEIIGLLCWHFKRIARAKKLEIEGASDSKISKKLGINNFYADDFIRQVRSTNLNALKKKMKILLDADVEMKRAKYSASTMLEFALIRLCLAR